MDTFGLVGRVSAGVPGGTTEDKQVKMYHYIELEMTANIVSTYIDVIVR